MFNSFVCPGCIHGSDTSCGKYKPETVDINNGRWCTNHCPATLMFPGGLMLLGMPVGFNKIRENKVTIRVYETIPIDKWDHLNVPVWAMEKDGYLFVRTFSPRISTSFIDVIKGGTLALVPQAIDVSKFIDEID